jgi:hypothetical protein
MRGISTLPQPASVEVVVTISRRFDYHIGLFENTPE